MMPLRQIRTIVDMCVITMQKNVSCAEDHIPIDALKSIVPELESLIKDLSNHAEMCQRYFNFVQRQCLEIDKRKGLIMQHAINGEGQALALKMLRDRFMEEITPEDIDAVRNPGAEETSGCEETAGEGSDIRPVTDQDGPSPTA